MHARKLSADTGSSGCHRVYEKELLQAQRVQLHSMLQTQPLYGTTGDSKTRIPIGGYGVYLNRLRPMWYGYVTSWVWLPIVTKQVNDREQQCAGDDRSTADAVTCQLGKCGGGQAAHQGL